MKIFDDDAILLASKKTAGLSGDIRKAFQICRAAAELVSRNWEANKENRGIQSGHPTVRISDVQKASLETFNISTTTAISFSSSFQALLLVSIASLKRTTGREGSFDIKDVMIKMEAVAGAAGDPQYSPPPSFGETIELLNSLAEVSVWCRMSCLLPFEANND
jgi:origin recognition complex subunit 1